MSTPSLLPYSLLHGCIHQYPLYVLLGHYGSGKTNLALNLAFMLKKAGKAPVLVDLDVVNPYFRSTDYQELIGEAGVAVTGPVFGNSNLDAPSLAPGIDTLIVEASLETPVILDVGGDPDGARALARYAPALNGVSGALVAMVVNFRRPETQQIASNLEMLQELEERAHVSIQALIGNTHLVEFTTREVVEASLAPLRELSEQSALPLVAVTVPEKLPKVEQKALQKAARTELLPIKRLVKTLWQ